jgi:hypothetical protein
LACPLQRCQPRPDRRWRLQPECLCQNLRYPKQAQSRHPEHRHRRREERRSRIKWFLKTTPKNNSESPGKTGAFNSYYNKEVQFQVPQFIETEDKIVGPLSLRQFIFIGAGGLLCGLLYFILQTWLWIFLAIIIMAVAISVSFVKIQGRPFARVIFSAFNFYWRPQTYVWQPEHEALTRHEEPKPAKPARKSASVADILAKMKIAAPAAKAVDSRAVVAQGSALHKSWQNVQTGEKMSDKEFTEKKMYGRYQIFQKMEGDRAAARRVDYR